MQGEMESAAASPSSAPPSAGRPHPTYKEMIVQALTELRDPSGSSLRAIASYITDHFSGLHNSHDALLSAHLRRLRSEGQLRVVSDSYFLSTAAPPPQQRRGPGRPPKPKAAQASPGQKRGRGRPRKNAGFASSALIPIFQGHKRGPGRPRKDAQVPVALAIVPPPPSGVKRGRGRPRKNALVQVASSSPLTGAVAAPPLPGVKRGRGRPRKNALALVAVASSSSPLPGVIAPPPPSGVKRGRGRPPKNALLVVPSSSPPQGVIAPPPPSGVKRGRGRPPKNSYPVALPLLGGKHDLAGWPQRNSQANISVSSNNDFGAKRGRGRPPKVVVAGKRKRGRPRKENIQPKSVQSAPLTKRGPGRPRKEKALENGHLEAAQTTRGGHEALPSQATDQGVASLTEKRGRGRPRKRPLETEPAQTGVAALAKRGRGRPRKENPSAGKSTETQGVLLAEGMDNEPANTGCVLVSGEEAAIAPLDVGAAMPGVDPIDSDVGTKSH